MRIGLIAALALFLLAGCKDKKVEPCAFEPDISGIKINLKFESLEDSLPAIRTKTQLVNFLSARPEIRDIFFNRQAYPSDSAFINELFGRFTNPHLDTLLIETHHVFGNGDELREELKKAFANLRYYYPEFNPPKIQTLITGLESDVFVSDSLVIIGLDYFLGKEARYRPNMFDYMLRRYEKSFIVPSIMLLMGIDNRFNKFDPDDKTVLGDMVSYGKAYYFTKQMLPCTSDSILIGYSKKEIDGSRKYENLIWSRFVEDQVLFGTSHLLKQKYIAERPRTIEVGEDCPGRIGTWVGWQIVKSYMHTHAEVTLPQLMEMQNAGQLFRESGYKPQVVKVPGKEKI